MYATCTVAGPKIQDQPFASEVVQRYLLLRITVNLGEGEVGTGTAHRRPCGSIFYWKSFGDREMKNEK